MGECGCGPSCFLTAEEAARLGLTGACWMRGTVRAAGEDGVCLTCGEKIAKAEVEKRFADG